MLLAITAMLIVPRSLHGVGVVFHVRWYWPLIALAIGLAFLPGRDIHVADRKWRSLFVLAGLLVPLVGVEIGIGLVIVSCAGACYLVTGLPALNRFGKRFEFAALIWLLMTTAAFVFVHVESRLESFNTLATLLGGTLTLFGEQLRVSDSTIFLNSEGKVAEVFCSMDKFGGLFPVLLWVGTIACCFNLNVRRDITLLLAVLFPAFAILRTSAVVSGLVHEMIDYRWWNEFFVAATYVPFAILLFVLTKFQLTPADSGNPEQRSILHPVYVSLAATGAILLIVAWNATDPGVAKQGAVVIDEAHSRWEWSEDPLNEELYGVKTVYSYYCMAEQLKEKYEVRRNFEPITDETLEDVSVLILKTPTSPYPQESREAIWKFVENGGGLWMIGDHTDIFGMNTHLNSIGNKYGIQLNPDSVIDPETNRQITIPGNTSHPIARGSDLFLWYTGDSVVAPFGSKDVFVSDRMLRDGRDLSKNTYFGDFDPALNERVGPVLQAVALPVEKGRVAVWTDSTLFSNFSIFLPNKMELAEGYIDWLNRKNGTFTDIRTWLLLTGGLFLFGGVFLGKDLSTTSFIWPSLAVGALLVYGINGAFYPEPDKLQRMDIAFYEPKAPVYHVPVTIPFNDPLPGQYLTSFVASQRAGQRPAVAFDIDEAVCGKSVVWLTPREPDEESVEEVLEKLETFVSDGGDLIVLDGGLGSYKMMKEIYSTFGVEESDLIPVNDSKDNQAASRPDWAQQVVNRHGSDVAAGGLLYVESEPVGRDGTEYGIAAGTPLMRFGAADGIPVVVRLQHGNGTVVLSSTRKIFSDMKLGANSAIPTRRQLVTLRLLYNIYRDPLAMENVARK